VNRNILLAADVLHARGMILAMMSLDLGFFALPEARFEGEHG